MAKFFIGVLVGLFLGASASAYGAVASRAGTLLGSTVTKDGQDVFSGPNVADACGRNRGVSFVVRKSLSIGIQSQPDILVDNPFTILVHDASLEHCGSAGPM